MRIITSRSRENRFRAAEDKLRGSEIPCRKIKAQVKVKFLDEE